VLTSTVGRETAQTGAPQAKEKKRMVALAPNRPFIDSVFK
jgi:hypothetical protein